MLNELFAIARGLAAAGLPVAAPHPDVKGVGKGDILRVRLAADGAIRSLEPIALKPGTGLWTLRDGQHNSFPYVKDRPLLSVPEDGAWKHEHSKLWRDLKSVNERRAELRRLRQEYGLKADRMKDWPGATLKRRVEERAALLGSLGKCDAAAVPAVFERFLAAIATPARLLANLADLLSANAERCDETWIEPACKTLVDGLAIYFDVSEDEFERDVGDPRQIGPVSSALSAANGARRGFCILEGIETSLHEGNFPQPNLPSLGQTYIFAKNAEIPAAKRYGRAADDAISVGREIVMRLAGGIAALTEPSRKSRTWALIPSEKPKGSDLLLAFLPAHLDLPITAVLAESEDVEEAYAALTKRVVKELDGSVRHASAQEQVQVCILRKVDPANRKAIYHRSPTAGEVHEAALRWRSGCRNVPAFLTLPVPEANKIRDVTPPDIAPTSLPRITRVSYASRGTKRVDVVGRPAAEAFALFFGEGHARRHARDLLDVFLTRHAVLLSGSAHLLRRGFEHSRSLDRTAALESITWIAVLLHKLGRSKEVYMSEAPFKLGQLLAAADVVHAGYCADLRSGDVPPTLLGNSVLGMAQSDPTKALAVLCRRWKPYGGWANRTVAARRKQAGLLDAAAKLGDKSKEQRALKDRSWAIRMALLQAQGAADLCHELADALRSVTVDDRFRAELLLGYIAGLPKTEKPDDNSEKMPERKDSNE